MSELPLALAAPDSFKGTFPATVVAELLARGVESAGARAERCPVADGGEGTLEVLAGALGAELVEACAADALGRRVKCLFGLLPDHSTAIVEAAQACGLGRLRAHERDARGASSRGAGELIVAAHAAGATRILLGVGGSACTDGGDGALQAIAEAGGLSGAELTVLCDVETSFEDAPRVFGPQKGATASDVAWLRSRLDALAVTFPRDPRGHPMTGAAGGLAGGLWGALGAGLVAGAPFVLDTVGFDTRLARASVVITGEGRLDEQTWEGKIVGEIRDRARGAGVPLHLVVGRSELEPDVVHRLGVGGLFEASGAEEIVGAGEAVGAELIASRPPARPPTAIPTYEADGGVNPRNG